MQRLGNEAIIKNGYHNPGRPLEEASTELPMQEASLLLIRKHQHTEMHNLRPASVVGQQECEGNPVSRVLPRAQTSTPSHGQSLGCSPMVLVCMLGQWVTCDVDTLQ